MTDETPTQGGSGGTGRRRAILAIAALALVLVTGAGVLYVKGSGAGNEVAAATCPRNDAIAKAIDTNARGEVAAVSPVDAPFSVSGLAFRNGDDAPASLADFSGKVLLVNMWATWCVPCRQEMPALDALERQEGGDDFAVVPVNVDNGSADKPKAFYAENDLRSLPFFHDGTMGVFRNLKEKGLAFGLPVSLLVDRGGCVRAAINGPAEWASPDAVRLIDAVRKNSGSA